MLFKRKIKVLSFCFTFMFIVSMSSINSYAKSHYEEEPNNTMETAQALEENNENAQDYSEGIFNM